MISLVKVLTKSVLDTLTRLFYNRSNNILSNHVKILHIKD